MYKRLNALLAILAFLLMLLIIPAICNAEGLGDDEWTKRLLDDVETELLKEAKPYRALTFGLYTKHWAGRDHTEGVDNHMIALEYNHLTLAWFRNSYGKETAFVGYGWHSPKLEKEDYWTRVNLYAGVLAGYGTKHPIRLGMLSPGMYPTVSLGYDIYSFELSAMPTFWWISFKVEF